MRGQGGQNSYMGDLICVVCRLTCAVGNEWHLKTLFGVISQRSMRIDPDT